MVLINKSRLNPVPDETKNPKKWPPVSRTTRLAGSSQRRDTSAALDQSFTSLSRHCWLVFHKLDWVCRARSQPKGGVGREGPWVDNRDGQRRKEITEQRRKGRSAKLWEAGLRGNKSERGNDPTFVFPKLPKTGFSHREGRQQSLAVFCHHGVSGVNTGLTWQDR